MPAVDSFWDWPLQSNEEVVKVINTTDRFEVGLDASFFGPKDVEVRLLFSETLGLGSLLQVKLWPYPEFFGSI